MSYQRNRSPNVILFVILSACLIILTGCSRSSGSSTPDNVQTTPGDTSITLSWNAVSGATSYNIYWSELPGEGTSGTAISGIEDTTYTLSGLVNGTTYYFVVTSQQDSTVSPASVQVYTSPNKYSKIDSSGTELTDWDCVEDNTSGLMWEVKADDGALRDKDWTYTWYDTDTTTNGGDAGKANGGTCVDTTNCDTEKYVAEVNSNGGICGYTDWRLPTKAELAGLLNCTYGVDCDLAEAPFISESYFPNSINYYWSSSSYEDRNDSAWIINIGYGYVNGFDKNYDAHVRLVRSP